MKQITRVQELENLREEAIARIRAVLDLRGSDYQLCDPEESEDLLEMPYERLDPHHNAFYIYNIGIDRVEAGGDGGILFDADCIETGENEETIRIGHVKTENLLIIADRIDYLEETGIHTPDPVPTKIVRERDTFNPENL